MILVLAVVYQRCLYYRSTLRSITVLLKVNLLLEGIVHLNIIFSYMKFNKICNLDHPVY